MKVHPIDIYVFSLVFTCDQREVGEGEGRRRQEQEENDGRRGPRWGEESKKKETAAAVGTTIGT